MGERPPGVGTEEGAQDHGIRSVGHGAMGPWASLTRLEEVTITQWRQNQKWTWGRIDSIVGKAFALHPAD